MVHENTVAAIVSDRGEEVRLFVAKAIHYQRTIEAAPWPKPAWEDQSEIYQKTALSLATAAILAMTEVVGRMAKQHAVQRSPHETRQ